MKASVRETFERFKFGGQPGKSQQVYILNLQEIRGIKFGTRNALQYFDNFYNAELFVRCHGSYSVKITDPIKFFMEVAARYSSLVYFDVLGDQFNAEFLTALQTAIGQMAVDGVRISSLPSKSMELSKYMATVLDEDWTQARGMDICSVGIASISYDEESKALINMRNQGAMMSDPTIREGYVRLYRKKHKRHVIRSMSLTQKGFEYVAQRDPEAVSMIYSRVNSSERIYPGWIDKILRLHAIAIGTVMSNAAGAMLLISQKPSLMSPAKRATNAVVPDPNKIYYYAAHELRVAIEEYSPESVSKSSRTIGIIVKGRCCFFLYFTGSTRMYWMKNSEENYAAAVKSLLLARGFGITSIHQIVIGSTMSVAQRLCHGAKPFGNKYFVVSTFFAQCLFLTNNKEGDTLLKLILHDELAMEINRAALSPFHPPRIPTREYDAIETSLDRPVLLNYQCDLLMLSDIHPMPEGFRGSPIMLCFDYQTQVIQRIVGPAIEVRPLESRLDYG